MTVTVMAMVELKHAAAELHVPPREMPARKSRLKEWIVPPIVVPAFLTLVFLIFVIIRGPAA